MKLKVCGMKYNPEEVAKLKPDYLGFIFWAPSSRFFEGEMPRSLEGIKKVGVFVDAPIDEVFEKIKNYRLHAVQLHGNESAGYCKDLMTRLSGISTKQGKSKKIPQSPEYSGSFRNSRTVEIIKVFSIHPDSYQNEFDFSILKEYEEVCDYFLFDTKGKLPGGTGLTFDWSMLKDYPSTKPYFLSGGIGLGEIDSLQEFMTRPESTYCHAIDVNSRFEVKPGLKDIERIKEFKKLLENELSR
ncbi:phosphoribosylanthranilate isomerase [Allomuricauda sp. SCSIO 65647]|uniref:phosphoribosylanthranilate isomerase n=1 Tax=Allomuricauda sp. SCSIO 65647 TaxID=2908843 RepID=UPI001F452698|nr:phosphoribosylanthranilate isomerase [Muricauda sp. SCSIO 65647]UJH68080.1 phosphoribosylanthranilate isomerase [Muricauda sp. SCSIO 65647]